MKKSELLSILLDWNFWEKELDSGFDRDAYLDVLKEILPNQQIKIITGARRSGKSFIMRQMAKHLIRNGTDKKNILIVNFEDPRFVELNTDVLGQIFDVYAEAQSPEGKIYIFLDEIQEVPRWEKWVRMTQELDKANITISGSNAHVLSKELATVLTGRHVDTTVLPLSFKEFLQFKGIDIKSEGSRLNKEAEIKKNVMEFLEYGSFPIVVLEEKRKKEILLDYYNDTVNRDLIRRYNIRKAETLKSLIKFYMSNIACPITFASSGKFLGISAETAERFSEYLETSYLVFFLKRFSYKFKEQERSPRKVYAVDTGIASTIGFQFSPNLGRFAENAVFLELKRRAYMNRFLEIYYWKSIAHEEVDFVVKEGDRVIELIQVCWDVSDIRTKKREVKALLKAMEEFKLEKGWIITEDYTGEETVDEKKIQYIPFSEWLLSSRT